MDFILHPNLVTKMFLIDLPLCRVLLEDERHYPWLFLVPRRLNVSRMMDLNEADQKQLIKELDVAQRIIWNQYLPEQINVAAIGNKTPQLHVHVIGRFLNDPAWPHTVWDHPVRAPYEEEEKRLMIELLTDCFTKEVFS